MLQARAPACSGWPAPGSAMPPTARTTRACATPPAGSGRTATPMPCSRPTTSWTGTLPTGSTGAGSRPRAARSPPGARTLPAATPDWRPRSRGFGSSSRPRAGGWRPGRSGTRASRSWPPVSRGPTGAGARPCAGPIRRRPPSISTTGASGSRTTAITSSCCRTSGRGRLAAGARRSRRSAACSATSTISPCSRRRSRRRTRASARTARGSCSTSQGGGRPSCAPACGRSARACSPNAKSRCPALPGLLARLAERSGERQRPGRGRLSGERPLRAGALRIPDLGRGLPRAAGPGRGAREPRGLPAADRRRRRQRQVPGGRPRDQASPGPARWPPAVACRRCAVPCPCRRP